MPVTAATVPPILSSVVRAELRASHAGETGAVWIYRGILAVTSDKAVKHFAKEHLQTEKQHLNAFESIIHLFRGSLLLPIWILMGLLTGAIPAVLGKRWVFYTIAIVEAFVVDHYQRQIDLLERDHHCPSTVINLMKACQLEEDNHRHDACHRLDNHITLPMLLWGWMVTKGSRTAVGLAKRL